MAGVRRPSATAASSSSGTAQKGADQFGTKRRKDEEIREEVERYSVSLHFLFSLVLVVCMSARSKVCGTVLFVGTTVLFCAAGMIWKRGARHQAPSTYISRRRSDMALIARRGQIGDRPDLAVFMGRILSTLPRI